MWVAGAGVKNLLQGRRMPDRATHVRVGAASGLVVAGYGARHAPGDELLAEMLGGLIGGVIGGALPDVLEPSTSPNHRQLAHSVVAGGAMTLARVTEWQASCRSRADASAARARTFPIGHAKRSHAEFEALAWRALAGILVGLVAGYLSHLVLDSGTARGLPFVGG